LELEKTEEYLDPCWREEHIGVTRKSNVLEEEGMIEAAYIERKTNTPWPLRCFRYPEWD